MDSGDVSTETLQNQTEKDDIFQFEKNHSEFVKVERADYRGYDLVSVRVFLGKVGDKDALPTVKGLTMRVEIWRKVLSAIQDLVE